MVNETAIVPKRELTPKVWEQIRLAAPVAATARFYRLNPEQVMFVMAKGYELGLPITAALDFIHPIKDQLSISPEGALALIHASKKLATLKIEDERDENGKPIGCTVTMKRDNGLEYTTSFTESDAERASLLSKDNYKAYPSNMYRWRAIGYCIDVLFPDIASGMKRPEELGADVDENGEPLPSTWQVEKPVVTMTQLPEVTEKVVVVESEPETVIEQVVEQVEPPKEEKPETKVPVLSDLIDEYGAQAILDANNGLIPQTDEQLKAVAVKLGSGDDAS